MIIFFLVYDLASLIACIVASVPDEVETAGDINKDAPIYEMGGTGVFVSALNRQIVEGKIDIAVHSAKDIPTIIPEEVEIAGALRRGAVGDVLISKTPLDKLRPGSVVGTFQKELCKCNMIRYLPQHGRMR